MMEDQMEDESGDREISLSPGIVLGVFLALALVCAVFFGFGYSVGRRSAPVPNTATAVQSAPILGGGSKPPPGSVAGAGRSSDKNASVVPDDSASDNSVVDSGATIPRERPAVQKPSSISAGVSNNVTTSLAPAPRPTTTFHVPAVVTPPPAPVASALGSAGGGSLVQVAAFSHQQDAELVAGALRKRGYDVSIRQQPQDSLLHVQLGPFGSKKEADAMRQRLQADGYNAIVK